MTATIVMRHALVDRNTTDIKQHFLRNSIKIQRVEISKMLVVI